jgi:two-component system response regulator AtoC
MENERVGGTVKSKLDVRVISATNYDLRQKIFEGKFREDLFYRIKVVSILIPDLKDRKEDIPLLVKYFLNEFSVKYQKKVSVSDETMKVLKSYDWPGNVRELRNIVENTVVLSGSYLIQPYHLPYAVWNEGERRTADGGKEMASDSEAKALFDIVADTERQAILKALSENQNNRTKTMKALGISRRTFYDKLNKYKIGSSDGGDHSHSL